MKLSILYRDEYLIAINKPSGLLVHRSSIDRHETRFAVQTLRDQVGEKVYPVHRLDKPTSGVLLFALTPEITQQVASEWAQVQKTYLTLTRGKLCDINLNHPIKHISENGVEKVQNAETQFERLATTKIVKTFGRKSANFSHTIFSLVKATPKTGRKHQIRKHLKHLHHPIVGDTRYGRGEINRYFRDVYQLNRLLLHCQAMQLHHPVTGSRLGFYAPLDNVWLSLLNCLAWDRV